MLLEENNYGVLLRRQWRAYGWKYMAESGAAGFVCGSSSGGGRRQWRTRKFENEEMMIILYAEHLKGKAAHLMGAVSWCHKRHILVLDSNLANTYYIGYTYFFSE